MKSLVAFLCAAVLVGCNPAARCSASVDCGGGVCNGGFCTDQQGVTAGGDGGNAVQRTDVDEDDGGAIERDAGTAPDAGDDGRGP